MDAFAVGMLAAFAGALAFGGYSFWTKRSLQRQIFHIREQLEEILDKDTDEKLMLFTDKPEVISLLNQMNRLLDERQRQKAEYRREELASKRMLANISHDMKTPLTVVLGYLEILRLDEELKENRMLKKVEEKAKQVMDLITEFFTLAKIEAGDTKLEFKKIDLCEVCRRNLLDFYEILTKEEYQVEPQIPARPVYIYADERALDRVLFNLLSNAVRYGSDGKYIGLTLEESEDAVKICVTDRGKGIEAEHMEHIFERLYTQEDSRNRCIEGNGLGLTITKGLVEQMGGSVTVKSEPRKETTFVVRFPKKTLAWEHAAADERNL